MKRNLLVTLAILAAAAFGLAAGNTAKANTDIFDQGWSAPAIQGAGSGAQTAVPPPACCVLIVTPIIPNPIVPQGGSFAWSGRICDTCSFAHTTDIWWGVVWANVFYQQGSFLNVTLASMQCLAGVFIQNVPNTAPTGSYIYRAYYGVYNSIKDDSSSFPFTVVASSNGGGGNSEWGVDMQRDFSLPTEFAVTGNYPNPFNASTRINYQLPEASQVTLEVYNLLGQKVATLLNGHEEAGYHTVNWDASQYSSGIYLYRLTAGDKVVTQRMTLLK